MLAVSCLGCVLSVSWYVLVAPWLVVSWLCLGRVFGVSWLCLGCVLIVSWLCFGCVLVVFWSCLGCVLTVSCCVFHSKFWVKEMLSWGHAELIFE